MVDHLPVIPWGETSRRLGEPYASFFMAMALTVQGWAAGSGLAMLFVFRTVRLMLA